MHSFDHNEDLFFIFLHTFISRLTCIPIDDRGVFKYSSAFDTRMALSQVSTELCESVDGCLFPAMTPAASMAMVTALVLSRLSLEL